MTAPPSPIPVGGGSFSPPHDAATGPIPADREAGDALQPSLAPTTTAGERRNGGLAADSRPIEIAGEHAPGILADSLADGMMLLLALTVVQRLVGFARSLLFCRWLSPDELGRWDLAFCFLLLAAPLAVLGLPGSFGRYVEHFRQKGQLRVFLRRTTFVAALCAAAGVLLVCLAPRAFSRLIFEDPGYARLTLVVGMTLAAVIVFNYLVELLTALRQIRAVSRMQFVNGLAFALFGSGLVLCWRAGAEAVVAAYGAACVVSSLGGLWLVARLWRSIPAADEPLPHAALWAKLVPLAGWIWVTNLLVNLFDVADRYMIVHFSGFDAEVAMAVVGQYHSSRVVPMLLVSVAALLTGVLVPYLSHDWEAGRREKVAATMNTVLKTVSLLLTAGGAAILLASPLLFSWAFSGKYERGLSVLPWTIIYCVWFALGNLGHAYLWCAERPRLGSMALVVGLVVNVALNLALVPLLGLLGAVLATAFANAVTLVLIYVCGSGAGLRIQRATWWVAALPLILAAGAWPAVVAVGLASVAALRSRWFFTEEEKSQFAALFDKYAGRLVRPCNAPSQ
jgi:PST family polysaccharide transporter